MGALRISRGTARDDEAVEADEVTEEDSHFLGIKGSEVDMLEIIGRGASGQVRRAIHRPTGSELAIKEINISAPERRKQMTNELLMLHSAGNTAEIVQCFGVWFREGAIYIAMEYMDAGSLGDLVSKHGAIPELPLAFITREVLRSLAFLRGRHLLHRDLKPQNVLLNRRGEVKVSDFGCAAELQDSMAMCGTFVGTVPYMAPERIAGESSGYSYAADVWSLGLVVVECALGRFPYEGYTGYFPILHAVLKEPSPELPEGEFSDELRDFARQCLRKDADDRPSARELLEHPFIAGADFTGLNMRNFLDHFTQASAAEEGAPAPGLVADTSRRTEPEGVPELVADDQPPGAQGRGGGAAESDRAPLAWWTSRLQSTGMDQTLHPGMSAPLATRPTRTDSVSTVQDLDDDALKQLTVLELNALHATCVANLRVTHLEFEVRGPPPPRGGWGTHSRPDDRMPPLPSPPPARTAAAGNRAPAPGPGLCIGPRDDPSAGGLRPWRADRCSSAHGPAPAAAPCRRRGRGCGGVGGAFDGMRGAVPRDVRTREHGQEMQAAAHRQAERRSLGQAGANGRCERGPSAAARRQRQSPRRRAAKGCRGAPRTGLYSRGPGGREVPLVEE